MLDLGSIIGTKSNFPVGGSGSSRNPSPCPTNSVFVFVSVVFFFNLARFFQSMTFVNRESLSHLAKPPAYKRFNY